MAWTEQCKYAFKVGAESLLHKRGGKGIVKVLRQLSRESEIPLSTLKKWYWPNKQNESKNGPDQSQEIPICPICEIKPCRTKKNNGEIYYFYPTCGKCQRDNEEIELQCPHCNQDFKILRKEIL